VIVLAREAAAQVEIAASTGREYNCGHSACPEAGTCYYVQVRERRRM